MAEEVVPKGYKKTEVGVIPEEWQPRRIGSVSKLYNGRAYALHEWKTSGIPVIRLQNLTGGESYYFSDLILSEEKYCNFGDLLYMWSATFGPHIWRGNKAIYHYHIWKVVPRIDYSEKEFLFHKLEDLTQEKKKRSTNGGTMLHFTKGEMEATIIAIPTIREQREIATALSDTDALIAGLDQLIAKKRALKQAAMQQLFTGKKRLPGFRGEWESKKLGDCLSSFPSYGINAAAVPYSDRLPAYIRITDISEDGRFKPETLVSVQSARSDQYFLQDGDVVFARTGASVGKSYRYRIQDGELVFAGFLIRVHPNAKVLSPFFLSEFVKTETYWKWIKLMSMRSGQPGVNGHEFTQLPISLPSIEEQSAIATILSDIDSELAALEQRRDKTRLLKQGMMQQLLTGRIRLLDPATPSPTRPIKRRAKSLATG